MLSFLADRERSNIELPPEEIGISLSCSKSMSRWPNKIQKTNNARCPHLNEVVSTGATDVTCPIARACSERPTIRKQLSSNDACNRHSLWQSKLISCTTPRKQHTPGRFIRLRQSSAAL